MAEYVGRYTSVSFSLEKQILLPIIIYFFLVKRDRNSG